MSINKMYFWIVVTILFATQCYVSSLETWHRIKAHGYPFKLYEYQSKDSNYMLGMERIPYSKHGNKTVGKPVILLSGMFATSIVYVSHNKSLGFIMSDGGFDVWLFNFRATGMSKKVKDPRTNKAPNLTSINWDFSFHEIAVYDLSAAIDLVINVTGYSKIDVGGVSLGATLPIILLSEKPEYNEKVRNLVLMGPTTRLGSQYRGVQYYFIRKSLQKFLLSKANYKSRFITFVKDPDNAVYGKYCRYRILGSFCVQGMNIVQGITNPLHTETLVDMYTTYPQPIALKCLKHFLQILTSEHFSNFDYGAIGNIAHYNSISVPEYNISKVTAPAIILYTKLDNVVTPKDMQWLLDNLPNVKDTFYIDNIPFSHQSFLMGKNTHLIVGPYILKMLT